MFQQNLGLSQVEEQNSRRRPDDAESSTRFKIHWSLIGKPWNFTTGDWQISRVYAALNQPDLALTFAKKALETSQKHNLSERLISAYEGMARAHAVAREYPLAREFVSKAREQLRAVSLDNENRKTYSDQIDETERMIPK